jgi:hypothetical protein
MLYVIRPDREETQDHLIPLDIRFALQHSLIERQHRHLARNKELAASLANLRQDCQRDLYTLIGEERYRDNLARCQALRDEFAQVPRMFPPTLEGERAGREQRRRLCMQKHDLYHNLGFDIYQARRIQKDYLARARAVADAYLVADLTMPPGDAAEEPSPTSNPWKWYLPPYGWQWSNILWFSGTAGSRWKDVHSWTTSGEMRLFSMQQLFGASDADASHIEAMTEIGFWFQMPAAGLVEVWAYLQDINTDYTGQLWDESGCSDADVRQLARIYIWTSNSVERYITHVDFKRGEQEGAWANYYTSPGSINSRHFFSNKAYAAGEWVAVTIGLQDSNYFWLNDMACKSVMTSQWFVKAAAVRSTGAP